MPALEDPDRADLLRAVMGLERNWRLIVYLVYYEGYSVNEAAEILNTKPSTAQSWLFRARKRLRNELLDNMGLCEEGQTYVSAKVP